MVQQIAQIIYCNPTSNYNFPTNITSIDLINGSIFNSYMPITQLGIQAPPGTKFFINNTETPIIIGFTGLYELDLTNGGNVTSLKFEEDSIKRVEEHDNLMIIVDIAYTGGGN